MTALIIVVVLAAIIVVALIVAYNGLVRARNQVENAWSQIDVQLKRRLDLVPNLVETVKGYAAHERDTLEAVVAARNSALGAADTPAAQAEASNMLSGALRQLFALSEAYPDLKANENFLALQEELTATEGRVAYAAPVLQRQRAHLRQQARIVPHGGRRTGLRLRIEGVLRSRGSGARRPQGRVLIRF